MAEDTCCHECVRDVCRACLTLCETCSTPTCSTECYRAHAGTCGEASSSTVPADHQPLPRSMLPRYLLGTAIMFECIQCHQEQPARNINAICSICTNFLCTTCAPPFVQVSVCSSECADQHTANMHPSAASADNTATGRATQPEQHAQPQLGPMPKALPPKGPPPGIKPRPPPLPEPRI